MKRLAPTADIAGLQQIRLGRKGITLTVPASLRTRVQERLADEGAVVTAGATPETLAITIPVNFPLRGDAKSVLAGQKDTKAPDPILINALRKAHRMVERENGLPAVACAPISPYDRRILRLAFLAPDIQRDILAGCQPRHLSLESLMQREIPIAWNEQRAVLGWH